MVVNAAFARDILSGGNPLGRRLRYVRTPEWMEPGSVDSIRPYIIVGVVADLHVNSLDPDAVPAVVYHPSGPPPRGAAILVKTRGAPAPDLPSRIREITASVDPSLRYESIEPFDAFNSEQRTLTRLASLLPTAVAAVVVLLSAAGIYALMSFTVARRRREIGIRTALGATPRRILSAVLARAGGQLALGLILGMAGTALVDALTSGLLFGERRVLLIPLFGGFMVAVGILATLGPARRGLRIQPMEALREE